jgi:glutamate-1-semialdehyde aminotransferase
MAGHAPAPTIEAVGAQMKRGITTMLPSEDGAAVGSEMKSRFGLDEWQFTLSAPDANRFAIRLAREISGRDKVLVFDHCYHGTVDETVVTLRDGRPVPRHGSIGPPIEPSRRRGSSSSTTPRRSNASSPVETWPASSRSPP